jgi:hypothetical protein
MASTIVELALAGRLASRAALRRLSGRAEAEPDRAAFRSALDELLGSLSPGVVREAHWVDIPADEPPWRDTGIELAPGQQATYFACGRVYVAKALDIWVPPSLQLWTRIGEKGPISSATRDSHTIVADSAGRLYFGNYFPNDWVSREGDTLHGSEAFKGAQGGITILVIVWEGAALDGLQALARQGDVGGAVAGEIERLRQGRTAPEDWNYLWHVGEAEIFKPLNRGEQGGGRNGVDCHTHRDAAIIQKEVDFPFTPQTRIAWSWKVDELPSDLREDTTPTHDYLSLAVEFDNGLDLSYYWSSTLPKEHFYACPLENWKDKETHLVIRSGAGELGSWLDEDRNLAEDYDRTIGKPATRIVRIWFIAVSLFQRRTGRCQYADIRLSDGSETLTVL